MMLSLKSIYGHYQSLIISLPLIIYATVIITVTNILSNNLKMIVYFQSIEHEH